MKAHIVLMLLIWWIATACQTTAQPPILKLYDLASRQTLSRPQVAERLSGQRLLLVGEHHNNPGHHAAQLAVIRFLHTQGVGVAVGLEMFRQNRQTVLDSWVAGEMSEKNFKREYLDNWNFDWRLYRDIFIYARDNKLPMVGLNVGREVTSQVAYRGFNSLDQEQRDALGAITCDVSADYMAYIRKAYGSHGHGGMDFTRFCEAQMVWDTVMARNALKYLKDNPQRAMVLIAGSGHTQRPGIPSQLGEPAPLPFAILLPETKGSFEREHIDAAVADYLILSP